MFHRGARREPRQQADCLRRLDLTDSLQQKFDCFANCGNGLRGVRRMPLMGALTGFL